MRSRSCRGDKLWVTGRTAVCVGAEVLTATHHFPVRQGGVLASSTRGSPIRHGAISTARIFRFSFFHRHIIIEMAFIP